MKSKGFLKYFGNLGPDFLAPDPIPPIPPDDGDDDDDPPPPPPEEP